MREIVINTQYGGFGVSKKAFVRLRELNNEYAWKETNEGERYCRNGDCKCLTTPKNQFNKYDSEGHIICDQFYGHMSNIPRDDKQLVQVVKELGEEADGEYATLKVVKIPDNVEWVVKEYDGYEHIAEKHRTWS